jgi:TatA/E family protein of Tat protein translocase
MLAIFDSLGFSELLIVVVVAVLVFGKRLPEVAAQAGQQIGKFRRSLQDVKNETGIDEDLRKIRRDIQNVVPRDLSMGEMARIASAELEKRMKASEEPKANALDAGVAESGAVAAPGQSSSASPHADPAAKLPPAPPADAGHPAAPADSAAHEAGGPQARED